MHTVEQCTEFCARILEYPEFCDLNNMSTGALKLVSTSALKFVS